MTTESWLLSRVDDVPARLIEEMVEALRQQAEGSIPDQLAEGAMHLLERVLAGTGGREDALPLLAADALLTHSFQAAAELDPQEVESFASRWADGGRLAGMLS